LEASRALVGVAARSLADLDDVTLPQYRALVLVRSRSRTTVSDLARALGIHPTSATRLCDRLVRKRLVRRTPARHDRREIELHLAAAGRRLLDDVTRRRRRDLASIAGAMDAGAVEGAVHALTAFAQAAEPAFLDEADVFGWNDSLR
jgi:DNA-binding MarR family transcriptional regulator